MTGYGVKAVPLFFKKAQMQILETIFVLIVVFLILGVGLYYFYDAYFKDIREGGEKIETTAGSVLLSLIPSMPEIRCSTGLNDEECVDVLKLFAFVQYLENRKTEYAPLFAGKTIRIIQAYPKTESGECTAEKISQLAFPENCNTFTLYADGGKRIVSVPVSLYYPEKDAHYIGKLEVVM